MISARFCCGPREEALSLFRPQFSCVHDGTVMRLWKSNVSHSVRGNGLPLWFSFTRGAGDQHPHLPRRLLEGHPPALDCLIQDKHDHICVRTRWSGQVELSLARTSHDLWVIPCVCPVTKQAAVPGAGFCGEGCSATLLCFQSIHQLLPLLWYI